MRMAIDDGHFFSGQGVLNVVYLPCRSESAMPHGENSPVPTHCPAMSPYGVAHRVFGVTKLVLRA